ncbi:MAG: YraN family protein [Actinomycetota bacterium]
MVVHAIVGRSDGRSGRGRDGEDAALRVYRRRGFRAVARNWRCPLGELDLVLERGGLLVFCEVKARTGAAFGGGYEAVTWSKRRKLRQLAEAFLAAGAPAHRQVRFDVASVWLGPGGADVEVFEDAF